MAVDDDATAERWGEMTLSLVSHLISSKWAVPVLLVLSARPLRRKQLKVMVNGINDDRLDAMLMRHQRWGLVNRSWIAGTRSDEPGYALTELGKSLLQVLEPLAAWQADHDDQLRANRQRWDGAHPATGR